VAVRAERIDQIREARARVHHAADEVADLKERLKNAKAQLQTAEVDLDGLIDQLVGGQDWKESPLGKAAGGSAPGGDEAWRAAELDGLNDLGQPEIPPGVLGKLAEAGIRTLGELTDWQKEHGDHWIADLPGIGPAAADHIAEATDAYWARRKAAGDEGDADGEGAEALDPEDVPFDDDEACPEQGSAGRVEGEDAA